VARFGIKAAGSAAALAISLAVAPAAHAADYFLQSASIDWTYTASISGPGYGPESAVLAPIHFTAYEGIGPVGPSMDLMAFCVDVYHNINVGTINLQYDDTQVFDNNSDSPTWEPISIEQQVLVGKLVNFGARLQLSGDPNRLAKLAAVQGAIWQVVNPSLTVDSSNDFVDSLIASYTSGSGLAQFGPLGSKLTFITEKGKYHTIAAHQSFAFAAVPEPGTWLLMIAGFGVVGGALRRARRAAAA
jgi:hypothetical protein